MVMRHEVNQLCLAAAHSMNLQRNDRAHLFGAGRQVETAVLISVGNPGHSLGIADAGFGFCNGSPADSVQHELVPKLIGGRQFFTRSAPVLFTS